MFSWGSPRAIPHRSPERLTHAVQNQQPCTQLGLNRVSLVRRDLGLGHAVLQLSDVSRHAAPAPAPARGLVCVAHAPLQDQEGRREIMQQQEGQGE